jgi:hypothetical protein
VNGGNATLDLIAGGTNAFTGDVTVAATGKYYMAADTYWSESAADVSSHFVGGVEALTIKEATNIVVGIQNASPEAWHTNYSALQVGGTGSIYSTTTEAVGNSLQIGQNVYINTSNQFARYLNDEATRYVQSNGTHSFGVAVAGTADTSFSFTEALTIANDANVGIGVSSLENWQSGWRALQIGGNAALFAHATPAASRHLYLTNNLYHDGSFKTISTDESNAIAMLHGTFVFKVGALASLDSTPTFTDALTIANNANVGIETENLATWTSTVSALQVGGTAGLSSETTQADGTKTWVSANAYHSSSTDTWKYISTNASDEANSIMFSDGAVRFRTAIAGVADAGISWINQLVLQNNSGSLSATFGGDIFVTKDDATLTITDTSASGAFSGGISILSSDDGVTMASGDRLGLYVFSGAEDGASTIKTGAYIASHTTEAWSNGNNGADLQFFTTPSTTASRVLALTLQQDQSALFANNVSIPSGFLNFGAEVEVTIATGAIAVTASNNAVIVEGGAGSGADALASATGGAAGDILMLSPKTSGVNATVTITDGTGAGAFICEGGANFVMDHVDDQWIGKHNGTEWKEISRSSNS